MERNNDILVYNVRDPLFGLSREHYIETIKNRLKGRVEKAFFFGSFVREDFNQESDIDMILVKNTDTPFVERPFEFGDLLDIIPTTQILVYTPEEFDQLMTDPSPGFWQSVVQDLTRVL